MTSSPSDVDISSSKQNWQQENEEEDGQGYVPSIQRGARSRFCNWETTHVKETEFNWGHNVIKTTNKTSDGVGERYW